MTNFWRFSRINFRILLNRNRLADLPMMAKGIDQTADAPAIRLVYYGPRPVCSGRNSAVKNHIGFIHNQDHADRPPAEPCRAEILIARRFICYPEFRFTDRQTSYNSSFL